MYAEQHCQCYCGCMCVRAGLRICMKERWSSLQLCLHRGLPGWMIIHESSTATLNGNERMPSGENNPNLERIQDIMRAKLKPESVLRKNSCRCFLFSAASRPTCFENEEKFSLVGPGVKGSTPFSGCALSESESGCMVHSSITDHILKRSSFWLALAMPLKFGIVGKLLVKRTRQSFPFRERRWHIWIMSSSQSASADWLSDSNGRSLWPISAAYLRCSDHNGLNRFNRHFCVWRPLSWVECLSGSHATLQRWRKGVNLQVDGFDTIFQCWTGFFFFFICSTSLH